MRSCRQGCVDPVARAATGPRMGIGKPVSGSEAALLSPAAWASKYWFPPIANWETRRAAPFEMIYVEGSGISRRRGLAAGRRQTRTRPTCRRRLVGDANARTLRRLDFSRPQCRCQIGRPTSGRASVEEEKRGKKKTEQISPGDADKLSRGMFLALEKYEIPAD